uniref:helix-turn-helix transcriptional regulator n=1 Tax=Eubacterium cellulosolvens TaxID=29322 RepID=UPI0006852004|nr:helix-turn-helix transcriptional regulator [[Eubacterium] cellulosolvens]
MSNEYIISDEKKEKLIGILTEELPALRAKLAITQEELCEIIGISLQTYSSIETQKRKMSWNVFLSLIMFFTNNDKTVPVIDSIGAFPEELKESLNISNR